MPRTDESGEAGHDGRSARLPGPPDAEKADAARPTDQDGPRVPSRRTKTRGGAGDRLPHVGMWACAALTRAAQPSSRPLAGSRGARAAPQQEAGATLS